MPLTPEASRELAALGRSLSALVGHLTAALADGAVTVDELIAIGCDVPDLIKAITDLATPADDETRIARVQAARKKHAAAQLLLARKKREAKLARLRKTRRAFVETPG